ncbi:hypothetical protein B0J11DRAFT_601627 [Dendryphion nanum]|uniref:tyrosinase n=1 Tax=Dendryphion nanum TaxID=256645 RepID=A0A9P9CYR3_9PLEO|nr:hypothetical protein B0J11DRAFT_601627 [Dendryphion nanum]
MVFVHSFTTLATAVVSLLSLSTATPVDRVSIEARQNDYFVIEGVKDGGVQPRLNIRDLERKPENKEIWTLFLLGLQRLQAQNQKDKTSFYQVAGIHGQPWIPWDNVPSWTPDPGYGYCPHSGNLFSTWHRVYMLTYEQLIHSHALTVVNEIKDANTKTRFRTAASKLRLPYWDWAQKTPAGEHSIPTSLMSDTLSITYPNGTAGTIVNPLRKYTFHPLVSSDFPGAGFPYDRWTSTLRWPDDPQSPTAKDNIPAMHERFDGNVQMKRAGLYKIFKSYQVFNNFSNAALFDFRDPKMIGNLETVHGTTHSDFANGHMEFPVVTAFDPIFWLHHANVDRQLAIWQAIYPTTWVERALNQNQGTYTLDAMNVPTDGNSPLTPFHRNKAGDFWTSNLVRDIKTLGYTYPELLNNPSNDTIKANIKNLYDDGTVKTVIKRQENGTHTSRDYNVRIISPAGYSTFVYLGETTSENFVGVYSTLFDLGMAKTDRLFSNTVGLSSKIIEAAEKGALKGTDEASVVEFLKKELKFKITDKDGVTVAPGEAPNVEISVISQLETIPESESEFPQIISVEEYHAIGGF